MSNKSCSGCCKRVDNNPCNDNDNSNQIDTSCSYRLSVDNSSSIGPAGGLLLPIASPNLQMPITIIDVGLGIAKPFQNDPQNQITVSSDFITINEPGEYLITFNIFILKNDNTQSLFQVLQNGETIFNFPTPAALCNNNPCLLPAPISAIYQYVNSATSSGLVQLNIGDTICLVVEPNNPAFACEISLSSSLCIQKIGTSLGNNNNINITNIGGFSELIQNPGSNSAFNVRTIQSSDASITITQNADNINLITSAGGTNLYNSSGTITDLVRICDTTGTLNFAGAGLGSPSNNFNFQNWYNITGTCTNNINLQATNQGIYRGLQKSTLGDLLSGQTTDILSGNGIVMRTLPIEYSSQVLVYNGAQLQVKRFTYTGINAVLANDYTLNPAITGPNYIGDWTIGPLAGMQGQYNNNFMTSFLFGRINVYLTGYCDVNLTVDIDWQGLLANSFSIVFELNGGNEIWPLGIQDQVSGPFRRTYNTSTCMFLAAGQYNIRMDIGVIDSPIILKRSQLTTAPYTQGACFSIRYRS